MAVVSGYGKRWADMEDDESLDLPPESGAHQIGKDGIKTTMTYVSDPKTGAPLERVITRSKVYTKIHRYNQAIEERKKWSKFGHESGESPELQVQPALPKEPTFIEAPKKTKLVAKSDAVPELSCIEQHQNDFAFMFKRTDKVEQLFELLNKPDLSATDVPTAENAKTSTERTGMPVATNTGRDYRDREEFIIRITNLAEEVDEMAIAGLMSRIKVDAPKIFVPKHDKTGKSRGFAFVTFYDKSHAEAAIEAYHRQGFANLVLGVMWAQPQRKKM